MRGMAINGCSDCEYMDTMNECFEKGYKNGKWIDEKLYKKHEKARDECDNCIWSD